MPIIFSLVEFCEAKFGRSPARTELLNGYSIPRAKGESATWHERSE
ncbi:MAG: hypothetical protein ACTSXY_12265 [Promethearchaeota archaeon]